MKLLFCPLSSKHQLKPRNTVVQVRERHCPHVNGGLQQG